MPENFDPAKAREARAKELGIRPDQMVEYYDYIGKEKHEWPQELQDHVTAASKEPGFAMAEAIAEWMKRK